MEHKVPRRNESAITVCSLHLQFAIRTLTIV